MTAASDKARFYLEQYVPELQEYAQKEIFTRDEISSIAAKRSDFEHTLNARGSTPADYARYATYEMNLSALVKKRCKRLGVKNDRSFSGQRTVFFILDRATKKFPGDMGLWMQYIQFCQKQKASKKLAKVLTQVLRLKPRDWSLWVLAAKWYTEEQGDMQTARSYMQRGLRFCKDKKELWVEYLRLEMVYLAKLAARRKILGLDEDRKQKSDVDEDENMITLPTITAEDLNPEASNDDQAVSGETLQKLANAPAFNGAIPIAIFDAAMTQFEHDSELSGRFFDVVATFEAVPAMPTILQHILNDLQSNAPKSPEAVLCECRLHLRGTEVLSADFPLVLGKALATINRALATVSEKRKPALAEGAVLALVPYARLHQDLDEDVNKVIEASLNRYLRLLSSQTSVAKHITSSKLVQTLVEIYGVRGHCGPEDMLQLAPQMESSG